jgi:SNF2 family DNA or RNA helicase
LPNVLYPYQEEGRDYLAANRRAYLGDDPGLGKTVQAAVAAQVVGAQRPLVICPAIARATWRRIWPQWCGVPLSVWSYDQVRNHAPPRHDLLILDEAHYCAHTSAKRTHAALLLANRASRVWLLSGSPARNHVGELYPALRAVWPDLLDGAMPYERFLERFCQTVPTRWGLKVVGVKDRGGLCTILSRIMLRRRLQDVDLELPPLRWEQTDLEIGEAEREELRESLEGLPEYRRLCELLAAGELPDEGEMATVRRYVGIMKAEPVAELVREVLDGDLTRKVVVMAYHRDVIELLRAHLSDYEPVVIHGGTSQRAREAAESNFQHAACNRVFIGQTTAAGQAITLTAGNEIIIAEPAWSPEDMRQAVKRIHRIGQTRACRARVCVLPGTIDEAVERVRLRKLRNLGEVISL